MSDRTYTEVESLRRLPGCSKGCDSGHYVNCNCSDGRGRCETCHGKRWDVPAHNYDALVERLAAYSHSHPEGDVGAWADLMRSLLREAASAITELVKERDDATASRNRVMAALLRRDIRATDTERALLDAIGSHMAQADRLATERDAADRLAKAVKAGLTYQSKDFAAARRGLRAALAEYEKARELR
jgi:hypothetical protein